MVNRIVSTSNYTKSILMNITHPPTHTSCHINIQISLQPTFLCPPHTTNAHKYNEIFNYLVCAMSETDAKWREIKKMLKASDIQQYGISQI